MAGQNTGIYSVIFSNAVSGGINVSPIIPLSITQTPVTNLLEFINNYLLDLDCDNIESSLNNAINQYKTDLTAVVAYILAQINSTQIIDFGYKAQLSRLLSIVNNILMNLSYLELQNSCNNNISANIIAWLLEDSLLLVGIIEIMTGISTINVCCTGKNKIVLDRYMARLINMITKLECTIGELLELINYVMYLNMNASRDKSYIAAYMPNQQISMPQSQSSMSFACAPCPPQHTCIGGATY